MEKNIFSKVYMWLFLGLMITFVTSFKVSTSYDLISLIFGGNLYWIIFIAEIVIAIILPVKLSKMSKTTAVILYLLYTLLTGITFATLFLMFTVSSIIFVFLVTSLLFLIFALIGRFTKLDLTKLGIFLLMALIGIILLKLINVFLLSESLDLTLCIIGLIVFLGYIAYDVQKIKVLNSYNMDESKLAIIGAFDLYLDFINLFIRLMRLFGKRRD